jgi:hypothetical protein
VSDEKLTHGTTPDEIRACVERRCLLVPAQATALLEQLAAAERWAEEWKRQAVLNGQRRDMEHELRTVEEGENDALQAQVARQAEQLAAAMGALDAAISKSWSARTSRRSPEELRFVDVDDLTAVRAAIAAAEQPAADPYLAPLASFETEAVVTEVREGSLQLSEADMKPAAEGGAG